jgi:hypothetical protein
VVSVPVFASPGLSPEEVADSDTNARAGGIGRPYPSLHDAVVRLVKALEMS